MVFPEMRRLLIECAAFFAVRGRSLQSTARHNAHLKKGEGTVRPKSDERNTAEKAAHKGP
jgi:hypothetical protein